MKKLINEIMPMAMSVVLTVKVSLLGSMLLLGFEASANHPLAISFTAETKPWQLVIDHELLAEKEAKIADHERDIARELQILLSENRYQAVADILVKRDISQDSAALLLLRGQVHLLLKNDQLAEQALLAGLVKMPQLIKAEQGLSLLYMQRQDYQKAKQHLIRAIELGVADSQIYGQLAYVHQQLEQPWAAVAGYRQALFLAPENIQYQQGLLYALLKSGDLAQAQVLLNQQLNTQPDNGQLWLHRAQLSLQLKQPEQALYALEVALLVNQHVNNKLNEKSIGHDIENLLLTAQLHLQHGSVYRAISLIEQASQHTHSTEQIKALFSTSVDAISWLIYQQQWTLADKLFQNVAQKFVGANKIPVTQQAKWQVLAGQLAQQQGKTVKAQQALLNALSLDANLGDALLALASSYQTQGKYEQASVMYVRAQALTPYQEAANLGLAQLAIEQNNYRQALQLLRTVVQKNPNRTDLVGNIRSLEHLVRHES